MVSVEKDTPARWCRWRWPRRCPKPPATRCRSGLREIVQQGEVSASARLWNFNRCPAPAATGSLSSALDPGPQINAWHLRAGMSRGRACRLCCRALLRGAWLQPLHPEESQQLLQRTDSSAGSTCPQSFMVGCQRRSVRSTKTSHRADTDPTSGRFAVLMPLNSTEER